MSSTILLRDLREGDCYYWSVSSQSEIIDDLMPEPLSRSHSGILDDLMPQPLSLRKQKPKEQGMSHLTTSNLTMMVQEQTLQRLPPHPINQQNQWNYYLHDQHPEQDSVAFKSLEHIPCTSCRTTASD